MTITLAITSILLSIISALYLQLPTFVLALGYKWSHNYAIKRWMLRILALFVGIYFLFMNPPLWGIISTSISFLFFLIFSLFNANPNLFIALNEEQIIKQKELIYDKDTEVTGYLDDSECAICYPVNEIVMPRHLLNDKFNGKPLLISYCAACSSTMIYNPTINGQRLTFDVVGVRRRNMLIRDIQTGTLWQQGTGEAVYGKLKGQRLKLLAYQQMTLENWLKEYPNSIIVKESENIRKGFISKIKLINILKQVTEKFVAPGNSSLQGLPLREQVWGLELNGKSKAYPISELQNTASFIDKIGSIEISIQYNSTNGKINGNIVSTNELLKFQNHWWFGWKEFHQNTEIWQKHFNPSKNNKGY